LFQRLVFFLVDRHIAWYPLQSSFHSEAAENT
jgi:hypothetical protein